MNIKTDQIDAAVAMSPRYSRGIWALGFFSMFMDISSKMIHSLLPVYMVAVLVTSALTAGIIEGIAEASASRRWQAATVAVT